MWVDLIEQMKLCLVEPMWLDQNDFSHFELIEMAFRYIHENIFVVMGTWRGRHNCLLLAVFFHSKAACLLLYPILMMCTIVVVAPPTHGTVVQCVLCHAAPLESSLVLA